MEQSWSPKPEEESLNGFIEVPARASKNPFRWLAGMTVTMQDPAPDSRFNGSDSEVSR